MCIFCKIVAKEIPATYVYEDDKVIVILDISQVTKGHTLVLPKEHYPNIYQVDPELLKHMISVTQSIAIKLKTKLSANGINILNNNEIAANQSVDHIHFHIIPRYDDNDGFKCEFQASNHDLNDVIKIINK